VASGRLRASNKSLKPTPPAFGLRRELEACATERSWTIFSCDAESQTRIDVPTDARNPWEQPRLVRPAYELGQDCHTVSIDIRFRCLQFGHATPKKFNSSLVAPTLTGRIELLSSVRPVFLSRFGCDANGRSVAEKL
jgi:hypothetical protein